MAITVPSIPSPTPDPFVPSTGTILYSYDAELVAVDIANVFTAEAAQIPDLGTLTSDSSPTEIASVNATAAPYAAQITSLYNQGIASEQDFSNWVISYANALQNIDTENMAAYNIEYSNDMQLGHYVAFDNVETVEEQDIGNPAFITSGSVDSLVNFFENVSTDEQGIERQMASAGIEAGVTPGPLSNAAITIPPLPIPTISGIVASQTDTSNVAIKPFAVVVVTDPNYVLDDSASITITNLSGTPTDALGPLSETGIGAYSLTKIGIGTYSIAPALEGTIALTSYLNSLTFTPQAGTTAILSLSVNDPSDGLTSTVSTTTITTSPTTTGFSNDLIVTDGGTQIATLAPATPSETAYSGPVAGLANEYINITPDNLNITAETPNWFLHSGSGEDALQAFGGTNVLDGGTGSNFLVGGTSAGEFDTFFVDDRGATADIWSTVVNFVSGDNATVWGITPAMFNIAIADGQGATGYTGLTFHATAPGAAEASLTLTGYTSADLTNGKITETFGIDAASGSPYMLLHAT